MLFYRTVLDHISHTWFDWNLVNGFSLVRKTVWINSRLQNFFIACVQHILLPKKIVKIINWSQLRKDCQPPHHFFQRTHSSKLTRTFFNFRVIHVLLSLVLFYRKALNQISHTWFDCNLVNGFFLCEENSMDKLKAATIFHSLFSLKKW